MGTPWPTLGLAGIYLLIVNLGPKITSKRSAFELRTPLVLYNFAAILLNLYIFLELLIVSVRLRYSWFCQPVSYSENEDEMRVAAALWWYYISKLVEFMDTF